MEKLRAEVSNSLKFLRVPVSYDYKPFARLVGLIELTGLGGDGSDTVINNFGSIGIAWHYIS